MQFLFVNKHAESTALSRSDRTEQLEINRHAQRIQYARRKVEKPDGRDEPDDTSASSTDARTDTQSRAPVAVKAGKLKLVSTVRGSKARKNGASRQIIPRNRKKVAWRVQPDAPVGNAWDPFFITKIPRDPWALAILDYYFCTAAPALTSFKVEIEANKRHTNEKFLREIVHSCLYDSAHFYVTAALTTARIREVTHETFFGQYDRSPTVEWLLHQGMHQLRGSINNALATNEVNSGLLFDINQLYYTAFYLHDYAAARIHVTIFAQLIRRLNGNSELDRYCRESWTFVDVKLSAETYTVPQIPITCEPMEEGIYQDVYRLLPTSLKVLGTQFDQVIHPNDTVGIEIMQDMTQWVQARHNTLTVTQPNQGLPRWVRRQGWTLISRFLCWQPMDDPEIPSFLAQARSDAIRGIAICWLGLQLTHIAKLRSLKLVLPKVKPAVLAAIPSFYSQEPQDGATGATNQSPHLEMVNPTTASLMSDLEIWLLFTGFYIAVSGNDDDPDWFRLPLRRLLRTRQITTAGALEDILSRYLYLPEPEKAALEMTMSDFEQINQGRGDVGEESFSSSPESSAFEVQENSTPLPMRAASFPTAAYSSLSKLPSSLS